MVKFNTADAKKRDRQRHADVTPSVLQIMHDKITELAEKYWAGNFDAGAKPPYEAQVVEDVYHEEIVRHKFQTKRIAVLEISQYLEKYLWPNYEPGTSSYAHVMSMVCMVNEKHREGVAIWDVFQTDSEKFPAFFRQVLAIIQDKEGYGLVEKCTILTFLSCAFSSLEIELVRKQVQHLVSLHVWHCLSEGRREQEFIRFPKWKKYWKAMLKRDEKESDEKKEQNKFMRSFLCNLIKNFLELIEIQDYTQPELDKYFLLYAERFIELMVDLQALLPTRRYLNVLIDDLHLIVKCNMSALLEHGDGNLFSQLLDRLKFYAHFEISNETGDALSEMDVMTIHYNKIISLQEAVFTKFPELRQFSLSNVNSVDTRSALLKHFKMLSFDKVKEMAAMLHLIHTDEGTDDDLTEDLLLEILIFHYERRVSQIKRLNAMALYPTEEMIWNENVVPSAYHSSSGQVLALPKLNLQFLTLHDYLLRNFDLFRLESTYQIRQDIEDAVFRLKPWKSEDDSTLFTGWARMAQPILRYAVVEVAKPHLGQNHPSRVRADVTITLSVRKEVKSEWEALRKHDACFLITVKPPNTTPVRYDLKGDFVSQVGLVYVRGCEVEGMLDGGGRLIEDGPGPRPHVPGDTRTFRVVMDPHQYKIDLDAIGKGEEDVYETLNIFLRRKPKENNFKAVLETIRDLMNINCVVPDWIHDIILGYGDPSSAHYSKLSNALKVLDFNDTFLDLKHIEESFPNHKVIIKENQSENVPERPFRLSFRDTEGKESEDSENGGESVVEVEPYTIEKRGPYPRNAPNLNKIRYTSTQVEAIRSGMQPGLTLVVGPPGTGKTDVATQIISNIYHNFPEQRTLIVTHSNQALNQLFEKIIALDVDERHLLRLGHGEEDLDTEKDFSRYGRVNFVLASRIDLLNEVDRLKQSLDVIGDVSYTCETSGFFFVYHVLPRWEEFNIKIRQSPAEEFPLEAVEQHFPFHKFFEDAPQPLFPKKSIAEDTEIANSCFRYIKKLFEQLEEFRAFELLRTGLDRSRYLLVKEAKIIAMTCTHAALKRRELVDLIFQYDNILMEESAQILEIETFIPLLLQNPEQGRIRLKRWIMIGDHHQLPPVVKNMAFQKYGNMEQSLFARFVRLGVPVVDLDAQGRARASISDLYKWRYKNLGDLSHVKTEQEYLLANPGFAFEYQVVNVENYNGIGESEPSPYFFQNLAEAEYVVATFMYMRLLGYPAEKITILTTYNGQKALIRDVINTRCGSNPVIGFPYKISTVDKYQGQQNDYILLSLVRTKTVGHLRDVRRLIVAMSRARLGLYIFARVKLFSNCFELTPVFDILNRRPKKLHLYQEETYPATRASAETIQEEKQKIINDMPEMVAYVYEMYMEKLNSLPQPADEVAAAENTPSLELSSEKPRPIPIEFEETFIIEKPAEVQLEQFIPSTTKEVGEAEPTDGIVTDESESHV